jgi:hypothetical protein
MIYRPDKEIVYCVGANLKDDGGDIKKSKNHAPTDVGVSLSLQQQTRV